MGDDEDVKGRSHAIGKVSGSKVEKLRETRGFVNAAPRPSAPRASPPPLGSSIEIIDRPKK
jgi:hypothetical protein